MSQALFISVMFKVIPVCIELFHMIPQCPVSLSQTYRLRFRWCVDVLDNRVLTGSLMLKGTKAFEDF